MTRRLAAVLVAAAVAAAVAAPGCGPAGPGGPGGQADEAREATGPAAHPVPTAAAGAATGPVRPGMPTVPAGDGRQVPRVTGGEPGPPGSIPATTLVAGRPAHVTVLPSTLLFAFDDAALRPEAAQELAAVVEVVRRVRAREILVAGYTSSEGDDPYNQALSTRRAEAIKAALVRAGVDPGTITAQGYGEQAPVASNDTSEGREANRRVLVTVMLP